MNRLFGLMLIASLMLSASVVYADHAPPNSTADVSIKYDVPVIHTGTGWILEAIIPVVTKVTENVVGETKTKYRADNQLYTARKKQTLKQGGNLPRRLS